MIVAAFIAAFGTGVGAHLAAAGNAYSSSGYYSVNGISYSNQAGIHTDHNNNHKAHASTSVWSSPSVSPGWMGAVPMRRNSSGSLLCTGTWLYNSGTSSGLGTSGCTIYNHSIYSSKGQTKGWNGGGYSTYNTFLSPNQNS